MKHDLSLSSLFRYAIDYIRQRLSLRLGLLVTFFITIIFTLVFNYIFYHGKDYMRKVAMDRATQLLDNTVVRINGIMNEAEIVTNYTAATMPGRLYPDSLLAITRQVVTDYSFFTGFAISMEPYYFPEMGRYFSAYSVNQDDTITTVREGPFEYFDKIWYKSSRTKGTACWVDAFDDYNEGTLSAKDILTSYCCPIRDNDGKFIGSITASLTLKWLSQAVTAVPSYPNSSAIMIGRTGIYLVHPDTSKLFRETIFSDAAAEAKQDIDALGKAMLAGRSGMMQTIVDGYESYIFYRPLERTGWSIAIVCPESDVFSGYHQLLYIVWVIISIGLLLLLLFCYQTVRRAMQPLKQLARQARSIANGHFDEPLPQSRRHDIVGRLNNSFIQIQQSLSESVSGIKRVNEELEKHNQELTHAYQLKIEADKRKTTFVQDMSHQIRTPLNIISGFTQVLSANLHELPDDEVADIITRMRLGAKSISRIAQMLSASSVNINNQALNHASFGCNELCRQAVSAVVPNNPKTVRIAFDTEVPETLTIHTDRQALLSILDELLYNANKFTKEGSITLGCCQKDEDSVNFIVSDTGPGIPASYRNRIFIQFTKLDSFSEGVGLGLSLCRNTARQLGGDLIYDDTYQDGTRFILTIPNR